MAANPVRHITIDANDVVRLAGFWAQLTGYAVDPDGDDQEVLLLPSNQDAPGLLFVAVGEEKLGKNRVHLDIEPPTGTRDEFVQRMLELGATVYEDHRTPDGRGWVTMRDPEDNEFCVERGAAERSGLPA